MAEIEGTLHTDASVREDLRAGGWAMWAASSKSRVVHSGHIPPRYCTGSTVAELAAVTAACNHLMRAWGQVPTILVRSDSQGAIMAVQGLANPNQRVRNDLMRELLVSLRGILGPTRLVTAWVKGHQGTKERAGWVNARCDKDARTRMRERVSTPDTPVPWLESDTTSPNITAATSTTRRSDGLIQLVSRFPGICAKCSGPIDKGTGILWDPRSGVAVHDNCQ